MLIVLSGTFVLYSRLRLLERNIIRYHIEAVFERILRLDKTKSVRGLLGTASATVFLHNAHQFEERSSGIGESAIRVLTMGRRSDIITVVVIDDHPLFRAGLEKVLELMGDIKIIGTGADGETGLRIIRELHPNVVLLDVNLPGINGLQVARQLKSDYEDVAFIIITAHHDIEQVLHAMRTGASAYCNKDIAAEQLMQIIRDVADGYYIADGIRMSRDELEDWMGQRIEDSTGPYIIDADGHYIPLSPREMEILEHVVRGMINKEIAKKLGISQQTVKNHMTSILKKLNVKDRTQAAVTAIRRGWVRADSSRQEA
jgi:DNA-binding NarL/FixJ family response regulator